jgi:NhaP-type Na+/H+ or K+/H+ antiporter
VSSTLIWVAGAILVVAAVSRRLSGTPLTPAMAFVALGVLGGPEVLDLVTDAPTNATVRTLAEATLALVLFADASRIDVAVLRRESAIPARLLGVGLPLTIALGALLAKALFPALTIAEALLLAVVLAPTDAALGQAVVTEPRLPLRIRQGLNVESGLNDGICVPLLFIVLAWAETEAHTTSHHALTIIAEEIGYGILGGVASGVAAGAIVRVAGRRGLITTPWLDVIPVAGAALAYGIAAALGGSGFIAAFLAGGIFGALAGRDGERAAPFIEQAGNLLDATTFVLFGAILLGPALTHVTWQVAAYAVLSLTLARMVPVAIAMLGSGAQRATVAFLGWFGPRGLASIVFAVIIVEESNLPHTNTILVTTYAAVGLSVFAHGLTAAPLADRYARWYESHPRAARPPMESAPATPHRLRGTARAHVPAPAPAPMGGER